MAEFQLIRAKRRSVSMRIDRGLNIIVRAPLKMPKEAVERFVEKHMDWVEKTRARLEEEIENTPTPAQIDKMKRDARAYLPGRVAHFAAILDVVPTGIKITSARSRWGSCSGKNALCFTYRLMELAPDLIDYIVVHELCHIEHKNHGHNFYAQIAQVLPHYKELVKGIKNP